jgi:hypothetical protein
MLLNNAIAAEVDHSGAGDTKLFACWGNSGKSRTTSWRKNVLSLHYYVMRKRKNSQPINHHRVAQAKDILVHQAINTYSAADSLEGCVLWVGV